MANKRMLVVRNLCAYAILLGLSVCSAQVASPEATIPPKLKSKVEPTYTEQARRAGITGKAVILVKGDRNGVPTELRFIKWIGKDSDNLLGLDQAAVQAVRQWRFYPQMKWGRPGPFWATVVVEFNFHRRPDQLPPQDPDRVVRI